MNGWIDFELETDMFQDPRIYITPYLPQAALNDATEWSRKKKVVFQKVLPEVHGAKCRNCQDAEFVLVSFCRAGPFREVPNHRVGEVLTWFDEGPGVGSGWFIVENTITYTCPHCSGKPLELAKQGPAEAPPAWWTET